MVLVHFIVPLPIKVENYYIGQLYNVAEESKLNTSGGEGVKVVTNEPYDNEHGVGQYTYKIYNVQHKLPYFATLVLPTDSCVFEEYAYNSYPNCHTKYSNKYLKDRFRLDIRSKHLVGPVKDDNVFNLSPEDLKRRKVVRINIADNSQLDKGTYDEKWDPTLVRSKKVSILPLKRDFEETCENFMECHKLYDIHCGVSLVGGMVENNIEKSSANFLRTFNRRVICSIDEWIEMTIEDLREHERKTSEELEKSFQQTTK